MKLYLTLILLLPLLGSIVNVLFGRKLPRRVVEVLACGMVWGAFASTLLLFLEYRAPARVELLSWLAAFDLQAPVSLYLDPLSLVMVLMITFVCGLIHIYSVAYMAGDEGYVRFFFLLNLFVFAMLLLVLAENLPLLYLGWEGVGFCSYALIGFWYRDERNATAGRKAFIVTRIGDVAFAIAVVWMFRMFGSLSITEINGMGVLMPAGAVTIIGLLLLAGAMGKSAQVPLMVWLPDAMAGPTPVSALIHAATMVTAGVYLLMRMFPLVGTSETVLTAIALTGGITAFYGATCALAQSDLKRVLAYSTISQIGYMMLGVGAGAVTAATFHLLVHAFFKALLFLGAGCVIAVMHHEQDICRMGGLRSRMPLTFWTFLAGAACLAGVPLTGGFFSKDAIMLAVLEKGTPLFYGLFLVGLLTALLTAVYTFRMVYLVFGGSGSVSPPLTGGGEGEGVPSRFITPTPTLPRQGGGRLRVMEAILIPLAMFGLCGGVLNLPDYLGQGWLTGWFAALPGPAAYGGRTPHGVDIIVQGVATCVVIAGFLFVHARYGGARREKAIEAAGAPSVVTLFFRAGWRFDDLYRLLFIRPYGLLARFFWERVDEGGIDDSFDRLAKLLGRAGQGLGSWTTGRVSVYLLSMAAGLAMIMGYLAWMVW